MAGESNPQTQIDIHAAAAAAGNTSLRMAMGVEAAASSEEKTAEQYAHYLETYGLGPQEVDQQVEFGTYKGTVSAMLDDEKCPVGGMLATAYEEGGITAVQAKYTVLGELDSKFKPTISNDTLKHHAEGRTDKTSFIKTELEKSQTEVVREEPDFLAL